MKLKYNKWAVLNHETILTAFHSSRSKAKRAAANTIDGINEYADSSIINDWWKENKKKYGLRTASLHIEITELNP